MNRMRKSVAGVLAALVAMAGLSLGLAAQEREQERQGQQEKTVKGAQEGGTITIFLKSVKVKPKTAQNEDWDAFEGKPDIRVYLQNLSNKDAKDFSSETRNDVFMAEYNVPTIAVKEGQRVEIQVLDVDVAVNDLCGKMELEITPEMIQKGSHDLSFQQVELLRLEFQTAKNGRGTEIKNNK